MNNFLLPCGFDGFSRGPLGILCTCLWDILMFYVSIFFCFKHILNYSQVYMYFTFALNWRNDILLLLFSLFSPGTGNGMVFLIGNV